MIAIHKVGGIKMSATAYEAVRPECLYQIEHIKWMMGWSHTAWRSAKKSGLKVRIAGKRRYVMGSDVISWIESLDAGDE